MFFYRESYKKFFQFFQSQKEKSHSTDCNSDNFVFFVIIGQMAQLQGWLVPNSNKLLDELSDIRTLPVSQVSFLAVEIENIEVDRHYS